MVFYHFMPQKTSGGRAHHHAAVFSKRMNYSYRDNYTYDLRNGLFAIYSMKRADIVMLGDSITFGVEWNELLSRDDIVNRGIIADTTEGFRNRLDNVYSLKPELCFIMGGINDICLGIPVNEIAANFSRIITSLKNHNIRPVIQSTLYMTKDMPEWETVNKKVDELNYLLKKISSDENVCYLDLNDVLSDKNSLVSEHSYDGLHLSGSAYAKWRNLILPVLQTMRHQAE